MTARKCKTTLKIAAVLLCGVWQAACGAAGQAVVCEAAGDTALTEATAEGEPGTLSPLDSATLLQQVLREVHIPIENSALLAVENVSQIPELPNGCEITAATAILRYYGFDVDKTMLADDYLPCETPYWEVDPNEAFMGNPHDELAYYCLPGPVVQAVNGYLADVGAADHRAVDLTGASLQNLEWYLTQGVPVLVWATRAFTDPLYEDDFTLPDGSAPFANLHCLVLVGFDEDTLFFADPMQEVRETDPATFTLRYEQVGMHAAVIL